MMTPVINALTPSTEWVDTIAMLGFSFAGILAARGRGVDPVGVFILAFTSAFGGVTVRDMLLDIRPFYCHTKLLPGSSSASPFLRRSLLPVFPTALHENSFFGPMLSVWVSFLHQRRFLRGRAAFHRSRAHWLA